MMVWLNHYWGRVETQGKTFEQWNIAKNNAEQIAGVFEQLAVQGIFAALEGGRRGS